MVQLLWDQTGTRFYETGIDKGVLYLSNGSVAVPWNGLISVEEEFSDDKVTPLYLEGVKYYDLPEYGDFKATLTAVTYPDQFDIYDGSYEKAPGLFIENQFSGLFGLSYRTLIGNDSLGTSYGYRIHILYNLRAQDSDQDYSTISDSINLNTFSWTLTAVPEPIKKSSGLEYAPTAHIICDSTLMNWALLGELENILYGTASTAPRLPSMSELALMMEFLFQVYDNGDGSWSVVGPTGLMVTNPDESFQIDYINSNVISADTYDVSTTPS